MSIFFGTILTIIAMILLVYLFISNKKKLENERLQKQEELRQRVGRYNKNF